MERKLREEVARHGDLKDSSPKERKVAKEYLKENYADSPSHMAKAKKALAELNKRAKAILVKEGKYIQPPKKRKKK